MKNDLGVDPDEWFNPLDSMPVAKDSPSWEDTAPSEYEPPHDNKYAPPERRAELEAESNPRPEEEVAEWFAENPDERDEIEKEKTMHQKMYEIATSRYNPFSLGGSENCDSDISCTFGGGSEKVRPQKSEEEFTPENDPYGGY